MLCQGLRKFIPALTASDVKTCEKVKGKITFRQKTAAPLTILPGGRLFIRFLLF